VPIDVGFGSVAASQQSSTWAAAYGQKQTLAIGNHRGYKFKILSLDF
jgi:hypothetical protein